jgi:nifR3 family TIM-barrel protein
MLSPVSLGGHVLAPPVLLAPMAGTTDLPFRKAAMSAGAPYVVSEMVAGDQLARARRDMVRRTAGSGVIAPLVIQLAGREARWMAEGARLAEDAGADVIDINMGCPSKSVTNGLSGSALMRAPDHALRLVEATVSGTCRPVTLKIRLGWCRGSMNAPEIARRAEAAGVRMIVVHGRTRQQFFNDAADWAAIRATVEAVTIPVIANGDIADAAGARRALAQSGAAGVMIGRAAQGRPWLPGAIAAALQDGGDVRKPSQPRILDLLTAIHEDSLSFYGTVLGMRIARKHISWAIAADATGLDETARREARAAVCRMTEPREVRAALARVFVDRDWRRAA